MPSVLVVDDSAIDRRLARGLLEKRPDLQILEAVDGEDALEQLELHLPDVVLTDLMMPNMNGLDLVSAVKKEHPLIPVILMTSLGSEEIAVEALKLGAANYVAKSRLADELLETLDRVLAAAGEVRTHARLMNRVLSSDNTFSVENDLSLIFSLVSYLRDSLSHMQFGDEAQRMRLGIALEEALLNAYYHGNLEVSSELRELDHQAYYDLAKKRCHESPYRDRRIFVQAKITRTEAVYTIRDEGKGFDRKTLPDPTDPANLERPSGRGLLLMQTFTDEIKFNAVGNEVTMIKRRG